MAAGLHHQDNAAGTETSHDTQGEHEAIPASRRKLFLVPFSQFILNRPNLLGLPICLGFYVVKRQFFISHFIVDHIHPIFLTISSGGINHKHKPCLQAPYNRLITHDTVI